MTLLGLVFSSPVHLSYSVSAIWQRMTEVSLYNKQEKYGSRNPALCVTVSGAQLRISRRSEAGPCVPAASGQAPAQLLLQPFPSSQRCSKTPGQQSCFLSLGFPILTAGLDQYSVSHGYYKSDPGLLCSALYSTGKQKVAAMKNLRVYREKPGKGKERAVNGR